MVHLVSLSSVLGGVDLLGMHSQRTQGSLAALDEFIHRFRSGPNRSGGQGEQFGCVKLHSTYFHGIAEYIAIKCLLSA